MSDEPRFVGAMTGQEKNLIAGCLRGDKTAWDSFVEQYSNLVYHTIRKTLGLYRAEFPNEQIDDLFQEFFLSILKDGFKKLRQFRGEGGCTLGSWLRLVASRLVIDFLRKKVPIPSQITDSVHAGDPTPDELVISQEEERLLEQGIKTLSPKERVFLDLCYRKGLTAEELAMHLNTSLAAIYTQKSRLLEKIRQTLRKSGSIK
jgi:RNA polymerase sigma-70 factor (ECF subfamily)